MLVCKDLLEQLMNMAVNGIEYQNDKWITIHPKGHEKGQPLLIKDGETPKQAIDRKFGKGDAEKDNKTHKITLNYYESDRPYIAKITGPHEKYKINREFQNPDDKDLSGSKKTGNITFNLKAGIYEIKQSYDKNRKNYFMVENGEKKSISYEEVLKKINK
jgi:hypothetical protein